MVSFLVLGATEALLAYRGLRAKPGCQRPLLTPSCLTQSRAMLLQEIVGSEASQWVQIWASTSGMVCLSGKLKSSLLSAESS